METQENIQISRPKLNIGFFFLSLGILISMITSVVSFLTLVFSTLDKQFPDILNSTFQYGYSTYDFETIRASLATLIIFFPLFILISYFWKKFTKGEMGSTDETIKKWLIYIVLFLSSLVIAIDLVILIKYFVSGEISERFIYKVIVTLITAFLIGSYYILLLKKSSKKIGLVFALIGIILVVGSIAYSFSIIGSPKEQRLLRLDNKRVTDLQNIQYQVINYWQQKGKLPLNIDSLSTPMTGYTQPVPPEFANGEKYEYRIIDEKNLSFQLCANFDLPISKGWKENTNFIGPTMMEKDMSQRIAIPTGGVNESWAHDKGRTCFDRTIDKDIYPIFKK